MLGLRRLARVLRGSDSSAPLCASPLGSREDYLRLWEEVRSKTYPVIDAYEREQGAAIDREWLDDLALRTQVVIKRSDLCYQHGRVLYAALRRYMRDRRHEHLNIVETGTARGFSTLCMARALSDAGASGKIVSFDVLPHEDVMYWNCYHDAEGPRTRADLLSDYAKLIERYIVFHQGDTRRLRDTVFPRVHFAFLDSVHTYDHVMAEYAAIQGRQREGDMLVFDDYSAAYPGVTRAADEICQAHAYASTCIEAGPSRRYLVAEKQ